MIQRQRYNFLIRFTFICIASAFLNRFDAALQKTLNSKRKGYHDKVNVTLHANTWLLLGVLLRC